MLASAYLCSLDFSAFVGVVVVVVVVGQSPDKWWRRPSDHLQPIILHTSPRPQGQVASSFVMEDIGRKTKVPHFAKTIKVFPCFRSSNKYLTFGRQ